MSKILVNHYYRFTYTSNEYVLLMCCHVISINKDTDNISVEGFTISRDGNFGRFSDGRIKLDNKFRKAEEITENEYYTAILLEQL